MLQFIGFLIVIIAAKLLYDLFKEHQTQRKTQKSKKSGEIIDISSHWIKVDDMPYRKREYLLSPRELALFQSLSNILKNTSYIVFPKVRLVDVLQLASDTDNRQEYYERVKERNIDLLVCELPELKPVLMVIVENQIEGKRKKMGDRFTGRVAKTAGIKCLHFSPSHLPSEDELHKQLTGVGLAI
ncbi:DUF2726 domain-containing protein [Syntrophomonas erecta]